tara:strand:+ start:52114 stop:53391 length:1278 start_codon:yes stop_codon:yes gene_type:complete
MSKYFAFLTIFLVIQGCKTKESVPADTKEYPVGEITRAQENSAESMQKPYVILVSIDGFRYDYAKRYGATNLLSFDASATKMIPSFPSKTFPNHYTIVSGLYPGHNGLVSNEFYAPDLKEMYAISNRNAVENGAFYKGKPLWVLASENQMVSASMFWVGSEAPIQGTYPTYYFKYNGKINYEQRVNQTVKWLRMPEKTRPHFITLYFSITDDVGHKHGPDSPEIADAVKSIDKTIGYLLSETSKLDVPVNIIVVSDHGMVEVDRKNLIYKDQLIPKGVIASTSFPLMIYSKNHSLVDSMYQSLKNDSVRFRTYLKTNMPAQFHYNKEDNTVGDLLIMPKPPYVFGTKGHPKAKGSSTHGYDPADCPNMGAIFYANGPLFIHNSKVDSFENVSIYPLIANMLSLDYEKNSIDGKLGVLGKVLKFIR